MPNNLRLCLRQLGLSLSSGSSIRKISKQTSAKPRTQEHFRNCDEVVRGHTGQNRTDSRSRHQTAVGSNSRDQRLEWAKLI